MFDSVIEISKKEQELKEFQITIDKMQLKIASLESIDSESKKELKGVQDELRFSKDASDKLQKALNHLNNVIIQKDAQIKKLNLEVKGKVEMEKDFNA